MKRDDKYVLRIRRSERTRQTTRVKSIVHSMLTEAAPYTSPDGLPSWWPFWSDVLVSAVRDCVKAARLVAEIEGRKTA